MVFGSKIAVLTYDIFRGLKAKIIQPRFQVSVNGNNFITKDNIQLRDIQASKVIYFYEIIYPI